MIGAIVVKYCLKKENYANSLGLKVNPLNNGFISSDWQYIYRSITLMNSERMNDIPTPTNPSLSYPVKYQLE